MENYSLQVLIMQGPTILLLFFLIFYLLRQRRIIQLEKRFEKFSLLSTYDEEKSIFDLMLDFIWKVIHKVRFFLQKSNVLKKYSLKYDKFIK